MVIIVLAIWIGICLLNPLLNDFLEFKIKIKMKNLKRKKVIHTKVITMKNTISGLSIYTA